MSYAFCHSRADPCFTCRYFSSSPILDDTGKLTFEVAPVVSGIVRVTFALNDGQDENNIYTESFDVIVLSVNLAPSFQLKQSNVRVAASDSIQSYEIEGFATNITLGSAGEDVGQEGSFVVSGCNTLDALFAESPVVSSAGTLLVTILPGTLAAHAECTLTLRDDGGTGNGGQDSSLEVPFSVTVARVNRAPSFEMTRTLVRASDQDGMVVIPAFLRAVRDGEDGSGPAQSLVFRVLTTAASTASLLAADPAIDSSGTLRFATAPEKFGYATIAVSLQDDGGTADGGQDTSVGPPSVFTLLVRPTPRILAVTPALGSARGGNTITVRGSYFLPAQSNGSSVSGSVLASIETLQMETAVFIGNQECSNMILRSDEEITCSPPPGKGLQNVTVTVIERVRQKLFKCCCVWGLLLLCSETALRIPGNMEAMLWELPANTAPQRELACDCIAVAAAQLPSGPKCCGRGDVRWVAGLRTDRRVGGGIPAG